MDLITTLSLILLTLLSLAATVLTLGKSSPETVSAAGWRRSKLALGADRWGLWVSTVGSGLVFLYRALTIHQGWQPLEAHVDGLLLIVCAAGGAVLFLQQKSRLPGVAIFALPVITLIEAWAICASAWTLYSFDIASTWKRLHLLAVYAGSMFFIVAAIAGGMYLYVRARLKHHTMTPTDTASDTALPNLERTERVIIRSSALGFALLTVGLGMGAVIIASQEDASLQWYSPKVVLGSLVWLTYAVVANVRHATAFRGARAAWLSIAGLALLLVTFGLSANLSQHRTAAQLDVNKSVTLPSMEDR